MVLAAIEGGGFADEPIPTARPRALRAFVRLDLDGDGKLSAVEFGRARIAARQPSLFKKLDTNGDGYLTREEAARSTRRRKR